MALRPYQSDCEESVTTNYRAGFNSQLVIMPTGTGKTVLFSQAPKWNPSKRTLILAHTEELVDQAQKKIEHWNPTLSVGVEMADRFCGRNDAVVVGSVPTLGREGSARLGTLHPEDFGAVVIDEAHHATASSYKRIINHFGFGLAKEAPKSTLLLGVTATAGRGDGEGLGQIFDKVTYQYSMLQAIKDGWVCPPVGYRVRTDESLDDVHMVAGDFKQGELSGAVNTKRRNRLIVKTWLEKGEGRPTLGFTVDIKHAQDMAEAFRAAGVKAEAIWGDDPNRESKLSRHRAGLITVLLNCGVLVEGYDDWRISCILLTAPTKSKLRFIQWVGRGTRLEELEDGSTPNLLTWTGRAIKRDCLVIDFEDSTNKHSLITLPSLFGLPSKLKQEGKPIVELIEEMEKIQRENPAADFESLYDLGDAAAYIESINLFSDNVDPVIAELSKWRWVLTAKGTYVINLPFNDSVVISQNLLGHWEAKGKVTGVEFDDYEVDLGNAVCNAERLVKQYWRGQRSTLNRKSKMPGEDLPVLPKQLKQLETLTEILNEEMPDISILNALQAQQLITRFQSRVRTG